MRCRRGRAGGTGWWVFGIGSGGMDWVGREWGGGGGRGPGWIITIANFPTGSGVGSRRKYLMIGGFHFHPLKRPSGTLNTALSRLLFHACRNSHCATATIHPSSLWKVCPSGLPLPDRPKPTPCSLGFDEFQDPISTHQADQSRKTYYPSCRHVARAKSPPSTTAHRRHLRVPLHKLFLSSVKH